MNKQERITASSWVTLSSFFFIVVQWKYFHLAKQAVYVEWDQLISWKSGWMIFIGICIITCLANLFYPKIINLNEKRRRNNFLAISIIANLSILAFFKYFNFFIENIEWIITGLHLEPAAFRLNIVLPIGISFYTFKNMSYTIDVYRGSLEAAGRYMDFALYVAFFPELLAGPIDRATKILPQIYHKREIKMKETLQGVHLILYGLFKKIAISDGVVKTVNQIFGSPGQIGWIDVIGASLLFTIQIYCDFSGYSDIAKGTAKLFGIDLMTNFNLPYFSRDPREFWSRWHISLSTWLRDYLYIPLGGNRKGTIKTYRNLIVTMLLGGLWHGAAWNFVLWGFYHGIILCLYRIRESIRIFKKVRSNIFLTLIKMSFFFMLTCYGWMLFRSPSLSTIKTFTSILFFDFGNIDFGTLRPRFAALFGLPIFFCIEIIEYIMNGERFYQKLPIPVWTGIYALMLIAIILGMVNESELFIYFTF